MRPTWVEPVKVSLRTIGESQSALPTAIDWVSSAGRMFNTPGGKPARWESSASASADRGVCSAGLITTVQPAASAGATLRVIMAFGKFQGVIAAQTPIGSLKTNRRLSAALLGNVSRSEEQTSELQSIRP